MDYSLKHIKKLYCFAVEKNFSFPDGTKDKPLKWFQRNYNGIGAEWMPRLVRKLCTFLLSPLEPAAMLHDVGFLNKNKSFWNFTKENLRFVVNAAKIGCVLQGCLFGVICEVFGWGAWKEGKETMAYCYYIKEDTDV